LVLCANQHSEHSHQAHQDPEHDGKTLGGKRKPNKATNSKRVDIDNRSITNALRRLAACSEDGRSIHASTIT
jgi:hypothetical protein